MSSFTLALYAFVHNNFCLVNLPWANPWTWYLCFIGVDFLYYWFHRAAHGKNMVFTSKSIVAIVNDSSLCNNLLQLFCFVLLQKPMCDNN